MMRRGWGGQWVEMIGGDERDGKIKWLNILCALSGRGWFFEKCAGRAAISGQDNGNLGELFFFLYPSALSNKWSNINFQTIVSIKIIKISKLPTISSKSFSTNHSIERKYIRRMKIKIEKHFHERNLSVSAQLLDHHSKLQDLYTYNGNEASRS